MNNVQRKSKYLTTKNRNKAMAFVVLPNQGINLPTERAFGSVASPDYEKLSLI